MSREPFHACPAVVHGTIPCICPAPVVKHEHSYPLSTGVCECGDEHPVLGPIRATTVIDLNGCARCLGDGHPQLEFRRLTHPVDIECPDCIAATLQAGCVACAPLTHWALCPTNGEPILMAIVPAPSAA